MSSETERIENSRSLSGIKRQVGTEMSPKKYIGEAFKLNNQTLYKKTLTGGRKAYFPVSVNINSCFEYRFTLRDVMLPSELSTVTNLYVTNIIAKMQDTFTQLYGGYNYNEGIQCFYDPYSAVIAQDADGIEVQKNYIKLPGKEKTVADFIKSSSVIQRVDNSLFVNTSNIKIEKNIDISSVNNSYKMLTINNSYDSQGNFSGKFIKETQFLTKEQIEDCLNFDPKLATKEEKAKKKIACIDVILLDLLIFMKKTENLDGPAIEDLEELPKVSNKRSIPINWLSQEEKIKKYSKEGKIIDTFVPNKIINYNNNKQQGNGSYDSPYDQDLPNDMFMYIDGQSIWDILFKVGRSTQQVFDDKLGIVAQGIHNIYSVIYELLSVEIATGY